MSRPAPPVTKYRDANGNTFAYELAPPWRDAPLVFSLCPEGPAADPFGQPCPMGQWTAPGWEADERPLPDSAAVAYGIWLRPAPEPPPRWQTLRAVLAIVTGR